MEGLNSAKVKLLLGLAVTLALFGKSNSEATKDLGVTINNYGSCDGSGDPKLEERVAKLEGQLNWVNGQTDERQHLVNSGFPAVRDCSDVYNRGNRSDDIYNLHPERGPAFNVPCVFDEEGQWTVIQQRKDGEVDFQRSWQEYRRGFGSFDSTFYLGNDKIHSLTTQRQYTLRIDLWDWADDSQFAEYQFFEIGNEDEKYALHYANYSGTAGDSLNEYHQNMPFSTLDRDNDEKESEHCAVLHGGGWWYRECDTGNLNGFYSYESELLGNTDQGIEWDTWMKKYSFKKTMMRIKPTFPF